MKTPTYTAEQYLHAFLALLPRGRAWPKEPDSNLTKTIAALMPTYELNGQRAADLVQDIFPASTAELLSEWEATVGLPDPCQGVSPTLEARRNQVVARFTNTGGQSVGHLVKFAADLGYPITITEYAPSRAGLMRAGEELIGQDATFAMKATAPLNNMRYFHAGNASAGEALSTWGNAVLECELNSIKPAHTTINFTYSS